MTAPELRMSRTFAAPPEKLWAAWTTPLGLASWWWASWPHTTYEVDLRVGGRYRIADPDAGIAVHGEYLGIDAPRRLEFSWVWVDDDGDGPLEHVTVEFGPDGAGTRIELRHTGPWTSTEPVDAYRQGWRHVLDALVTTISNPSAT